MKTPEQLAEDYIDKFYPSQSWSATTRRQIHKAFLAGWWMNQVASKN